MPVMQMAQSMIPILLAGWVAINGLFCVSEWKPTAWWNYDEQIKYEVIENGECTNIVIKDGKTYIDTTIAINEKKNYKLCIRIYSNGKEELFDNTSLGEKEFQKRLTDREKMVVERINKESGKK